MVSKKSSKNIGKKARSNQVPERDERGLWKKGSSGNPSGRPSKGYSIADRMREMFEETPEYKDMIIKSMIVAATKKGDVQAAKYLSSYIDGLPAQANIESDQIDRLTQHFDGLTERLKKIR